MAVSVLSLINRAYRLAVGTGADPHASPVVDNAWAFEEAFPLALSKSVEEIGLSPAEIEHYRRQFELTMVDGSADLPQDVLHRFLDSSTISSDDDPSVGSSSSFCNRWSEFMNPPHLGLHYYATTQNTFRYREAGQDIDAFDGVITLHAVSTPAIPSSITGTMTLPDDIADRTVEILAMMISGRATA